MSIKQILFKRFFVFSLLFSLFIIVPGYTAAIDDTIEYTGKKVMLLSYLIRNNIETGHFTHKKIDDNISEAAFGLYLKQLDFQKMVLLQEDIERLRKYSKHIDDEIISGKLELPLKGYETLSARAFMVSGMVREILSEDFDFTAKEFIETGTEKADYSKTDGDLKERWRKLLKYQVLLQYLNQPEDQTPGEKEIPKPLYKPEDKKQQTDEELRKSAHEKVLKTYERFFSRISQEKEIEHYERFFTALTYAFDPHTEYMPPVNKEDFDIHMSGSLEGIGATLKEDENHIKVVTIVAGSPASRQKQLQPEDIILKVAEGANEPVDIIGMRLRDAVKLIRGKKGTEVRLTIKKPDDKILVLSIVRDIIQIEETFVKGTIIKDEETGNKFGYIKVPSFYRDFEKTKNNSGGRNSTDDVRTELNNFKSQNIKGVIIDLRNNGGGALIDAINIAGLFIKTGPVVQVKNGNGRTSTLSDDDANIIYTGPLAILVNKFSASASEILAGAFQDYGRAVIIGSEHTHGKGTVQTLFDLDDNIQDKTMEKYKPLGALRLTVQKFYRISGDSTQYRGITPDLVLPDVISSLKTGEQYLDFALPWDTVNPVPFTKWPKCGPDISELKGKSLKRIASDRKWIEIKNRSEKFAERQRNTLKSLNIKDMRKEIEETRKEKDTEGPHNQPKSNEETKTPEEKKEAFQKDISGDDYVKEAVSVIGDIIKADPSCISITLN
jgi:carboxyl-terminal processing protease